MFTNVHENGVYGEKMELKERLLYESLRIRLVEEKIIEIYPTDLIQSPVHLSIGQEAVAVGICSNLKIIKNL